jgi:hypothetical protein
MTETRRNTRGDEEILGRAADHPRRAAQVRGVLAEQVLIATPLDPFLSLRALATYSGLSTRKLRDHLQDSAHALPCYRIGGKILVRRSEYDAWASRYRQVGELNVERVVAGALRDLGHVPKPRGGPRAA